MQATTTNPIATNKLTAQEILAKLIAFPVLRRSK